MLLLAAAVAVMVLIGQRMPLLLLMFGLVLMGLLLPRLRSAVVVALVAGGGLLAASVVVAPAAFYRLVTKFSRQMADFGDSPYGLIAGRSVAIAEQHPLTGRGYDGFRSGCALPRYFQGWHWPWTTTASDGGGAALCVTHPHNLYLQALTDAGVPGFLLFCALVGAWLYQLGHGLRRQPDPLRVGLFVAAFIQVWPIASTSPMISMPIGGWFFLLLGFGLAVKPQPA
jgi:O-antigen ligase